MFLFFCVGGEVEDLVGVTTVRVVEVVDMVDMGAVGISIVEAGEDTTGGTEHTHHGDCDCD